MNIKISREQFELKSKSQQVQCQKHKKPIVYLNIEQNVQDGERICCDQCPSIGQRVLFLRPAEDLIYQWYLLENKEIENQIQEFNSLMMQLAKILEQKEQEFMKLIKIQYQQITSLSQEYSSYISKIQKTKLNDYIIRFSQSEPINQQILSDLSEYLSQQKISQNQILFQDKINFYETIYKDFYPKIVQQLDSINQLQVTSHDQMIFMFQQQFLKSLIKQNDQLKQQFKYKYSKQLSGHQENISAVAISEDDQYIASGDGNGLIILWDVDNMKQIQQFKGDQNNGISDLVFSQKYLAVAQFPFKFKSFLVKCFSDILLIEYRNQFQFSQIRLEGPQNCSINKLLFIEDFDALLSGRNDKALMIWNIEDQHCIQFFKQSNSVNGLAVSIDLQFVSSCCADGKAYLFNTPKISKWNELFCWQAHDNSASSVLFTPDSRNIITSSKEIKVWNIINLLNADSRSPISRIQCENYVCCLTLNINNDIIMYNDGKIRFWQKYNENAINQIDIDGGYGNNKDQKFVVTSNMRYIITGGGNQILQVYQQDLS